MFDEEITRLEKEIDELSPKLESLEEQMKDKVRELYHYQEKKYRFELGIDKEIKKIRKSKYLDLPEHLKGLPDKYIHKRTSFGGKVRYFLNESKIISDNAEKNRKRFKKERGYESP